MRLFRRGVPAAFVILLTVLFLKGSTLNVPTGTWQSASNMSGARADAVAVLVPDGRIVLAGGTDSTGAPTASAEAFSVDGTFSALPTMSIARARHAAIYTMTGDLLVTGGVTSGGGFTNTAEAFDSLTNSWHSLSATMVESRAGHTMSQLQNGNILIAGGENSSGPVAALEIYDITSGQFSFAGTLTTARRGHAAAVLNDGRVLIIGGTTVQSDGTSATLASTEFYDPATSQVTAGPSLATPRTNTTATTLLDGRVLVVGGSYPEGANGAAPELASAEIYDPVSNTFTASASHLTTARAGHLAFLLPNNNNVLIAGGTATQPDGTVSPLASAELYTPWTDSFSTTAPMSTARDAATGSALNNTYGFGTDGLLLMAGGTNQNSAEVYGFATVKTDKSDYAPGEVVTITGSGWRPNETVTLSFRESTGFDTPGPFVVTADASGDILDAEFAPDSNDLNVRFYLTAVGSGSGLQTQNTFTDAPPNATITVTASPSGALGGTFSITRIQPNGNQQASGGTTPQSFQAQPSTAFSVTNIQSSVHGCTYTGPATVNGTAGAANTTTTVTLTYQCIVSTTLSVSPSTGTYGGTANFSATLTANGSPVSLKMVSFTLNGNNLGTATTDSNGIATLNNVTLSEINAGSYSNAISASFSGDSSYGASSGTGTLTVDPAHLTVTADNQTKTYGAAVPSPLTATITGFVLSQTLSTSGVTGTADCTTTATMNSAVNTTTGYPITCTVGTLTATNYDFTNFVAGKLTITAAHLTVTADDQTKAYGAAVPSPLTSTITGFVLGQNLGTSGVTGSASCTTTATASSDVNGTTGYPITCTVGTLTATNYDFTNFVAGKLTVTAAHLTVTADNQTKAYGAALPSPLTATISGFVLGQNLGSSGVTGAAACTTTATPSTPVSSSPVDITCSAGTLTATNYDFTNFVAGHLTITKAHLTVTADNQTKTYGAAVPSPLTSTITGFVLSENLATSGVTGSANCTTTASSSSDVNGATGYPITCTVGTLTATNYDFTNFVAGKLTVTPAPLTITANDATKVLNAPNPTFTVTYNGFVLGQDSSVLGGSLTFTTPATQTSPVGSYSVTPSGLTSNNYAITFVAGTLHIVYASTGQCLGDAGHQILQPINWDGTSVFKQGSTTPAKFRVCDASGVSIGTAGVVSSFRIIQTIAGTVSTDVNLSVDSTTPDTAFRWDPTGQQWIYNISTKGMGKNITYVFQITLNDGTTITFQYGLR